MSPVLTPAYTGDLKYPAYRDRIMMGSIVQPGAVNEFAGRVSAGSGLQVNVNPGSLFVGQTPSGVGEIGNEQNIYNVPIEAVSNPYNSVVVSAANPQIAQIILRVYDVEELKIGGSSYSRIEWLNGTPTASATEAKMKEGKFEGAAALPTSSLRLSYVLVPKNATKSSEYFIMDKRSWSSISPWASLELATGVIAGNAVTPSVRIDNTGVVRFKGLLQNNKGSGITAGSTIATLPMSMWPTVATISMSSIIPTASTPVVMRITTAGLLNLLSPTWENTNTLVIDGLSFVAS